MRFFDRCTPCGAGTFSTPCELERAVLVSVCPSLLKTLSRTVFVVTTVVSLMRLDRKTWDFCYRLEFGSQPQVFSQGEGGTSENSSDLGLGRRPVSKSEDFSEVPPLLIEIRRCEDSNFFEIASLYRSFTPRVWGGIST